MNEERLKEFVESSFLKPILEIDGVDRCFRTIGVGLYLQGSLKLLIFVSVPMKADTDAHVLQHERVLPLLVLDMRRG